LQGCIDETRHDAEISVQPACGIGQSDEDAADMTTYDAREKIPPHLAHSELRSDLVYSDLHGGLPVASRLQAVEKKLIGFSLGIGLVLLTALAVINHVFPATP
jgi:hypothetical protein